MIDLDSLEALCNSATPGEWRVLSEGEYDGKTIAADAADSRDYAGSHDHVCHLDDGEYIVNNRGVADAALIVALRNAAPAIISELRASRSALNANAGLVLAMQTELDETRCDVQRIWDHFTKASESMREYAIALRALVDALDARPSGGLTIKAHEAYQAACRVLEWKHGG